MSSTLAIGCGVKPEATSSMIEVLTPIWQRVLQLSSVQADDDFFDLGGDDLLALELCTEIAQACHRELPPATIYQARTIATLAALLEQTNALKFPALVHLKKGAKTPPVFIAHGLSGSVIDFFQTVTISNPTTQRMREADYAASRGYRPRFYRGRIKFVRAAIGSYFPSNPTAVWAHLVKEHEVETTPGDHVGMLTIHCQDLGLVLSRYLRESATERGGE